MRLKGERPRNGKTLPLSTTEFGGPTFRPSWGKLHLIHNFQSAAAAVLGIPSGDNKRFFHDSYSREPGIQGCARILKNELNLLSEWHGTTVVERGDILAIEPDLT